MVKTDNIIIVGSKHVIFDKKTQNNINVSLTSPALFNSAASPLRAAADEVM
jgi:hypothetical protein